MRISREIVLQAEHDLLSEASVWSRDTAEANEKLAYYNEGAHDMASAILHLLDLLAGDGGITNERT